MRKQQEQINTFVFSVELEVPKSVDFPSQELMENLQDAIHAYDGKGRLFNGRRLEDGHPCIVGSSVGLDKVKRADWLWPSNITENWEAPPFWDDGAEDRHKAVDLSVAIDSKVEELRDIQAKLWAAYHALLDCKTEAEFKKARANLRRRNTKLSKMFPDAAT